MGDTFEPVVSIAEGKRSFSRIVRAAEVDKREVVVTRRGKPVAVIVPIEAYSEGRKADGYRRIMEARAAYGKARVEAAAVIDEARRGLRRRP
jgi:prevent-host-death family protein